MAGRQILSLLREHQFVELDRVLNLAQQRFENGLGGEEELHGLLHSFEQADDRLGEHFSAWFDATPVQYGKLLALGWWLFQMGWQSRGGSTSNHVSDRGWRDLGNALEQAGSYCEAAIKLSSRPLHAYLLQAAIAHTIGNSLSEEDLRSERYPQWYAAGVKVYPESWLLRHNLLMSLRTEWGGSEEMMLTFVRQQEQQGFPDSQKLWAAYHAAVAHYQAHFVHNASQALERAKLAAQLNPRKYRPLLFEMMDAAKAPQREQEQVIQEIVRDLSADQNLGTNFYLAFTHARDWFAPYVTSIGNHMLARAEQGDDESLMMLGYYRLYRSSFAWPDPLPLLIEARERGHAKAAAFIVHLKRKALEDSGGTNPTAKAALREEIVKAADLGDADMSWEIVSEFAEFQQQFGWPHDERLKYSLTAADAGNDLARVMLANLLVKNTVSLGEDGQLHLVFGETIPLPTQRSLDYGRHLLERAVHSGNELAKETWDAIPEWRWDAEAIKRKVEIQENREKYGRSSQVATKPTPAPAQSPKTRDDPPQKGGITGLWNSLRGKK